MAKRRNSKSRLKLGKKKRSEVYRRSKVKKRRLVKRLTISPLIRAKQKLTLAEQHQVCQWLAEFYGCQEVADLCKEEFDVEVTRQNIFISYRNANRWKPTIKKLRDNFLKELQTIPIANKAVRLQRLEKAYKEGMTWYTSSRNQFGTIEKLELGAAISAIKQAQDEMEGSKLQVEHSGQIGMVRYLPAKDKP